MTHEIQNSSLLKIVLLVGCKWSLLPNVPKVYSNKKCSLCQALKLYAVDQPQQNGPADQLEQTGYFRKTGFKETETEKNNVFFTLIM